MLILSLFLSWYGVSVEGPAAQFAQSIDTSFSAWSAFDIADLVFFIVGLLAIAPAAFDVFDLEIELPFDISFVALVGGAISVLWIIFRIIEKPGPDFPDVPGFEANLGIKYGIIIALVGAALIVFGGFRQKQEDEAAPTFTDPVSGQQHATPQAPPAGAPPAPGVPPQAPPPAAAPPAPQAPPPGQPPQPPAGPGV